MTHTKDNSIDGKIILITGGTGSFGKKLTEVILNHYKPRKLIIFSRDELKQYEMAQQFSEARYPCIRYFIGDVRDRERLYRAFDGVDVVIHAAALKHVPIAEYNPLEAIKTNILGAANVIDAAIDCGVRKVIALSTDKAVNPINLYGATKLASDKLFVASNSYSGDSGTRFSVVRYGNVVGSRGSVVPLFLKMRETGVLTITDPRMTRFWITLEQGVQFVLDNLERMHGGEIFIPKIPSMCVTDLAKAIDPECAVKVVGIRPGEKLHEVLISEDDTRSTLDFGTYYAVMPIVPNSHVQVFVDGVAGKPCPDGFRYASDTNTDWLTLDQIREMAGLSDGDKAMAD
ncbi:MAG TPA: UDP-N-acetylglucosamine 4,6-dehydratase (inverting) [Anaerolineaceae bacterium]|nr:UDP-N-acetylglucosamine 4,6-dehydratase (inverting) [Anaerolineaceae bacterium]HPN52474.1 UDP-N-acetylglucosamine 4,6-dehydratase (inverting) [Anaerolineaceae bacterium]